MNEREDAPQKKGVWRILRVLLPLLFLLTGFFGVQIWMLWDERNNVKPESPVSSPVNANSAKAELAKLKQPSGDGSSTVQIKTDNLVTKTEHAIAAAIPGMEYYRIQVGSFNDPAGAERLRKKLKDMGYGSTVIKEGQLFDVVVMSFFSREQAENLQSKLEAEAVSGFPEKAVIPPRMLMLQGDSRRLQDFIDGTLIEVPEMIRELCDFYYLYESQGMDRKAHETLVLKQITTVSDMKTGVENMQVGLEDQALQSELKDFLSGYLQYLEKIRKIETFDRSALWPGLQDRIAAFGHLGEQKSVN